MSKCYVFKENGLKLSQEQLVQKMTAELLSNPQLAGLAAAVFSGEVSTQSEVSKKIQELNKDYEKTTKSFEGVSHFLEQKHSLNDDGSVQYLFPEYNKENRIENYVKRNQEEGIDPSLSREEIIAQIEDEQLEKDMGTLQHAFLQALFESEGNLSTIKIQKVSEEIQKNLDKKVEGKNRTLRDIITESNPKLTDSQIIAKLLENAKQIYERYVNDPQYAGAKFFAETGLSTSDVKSPDIKFTGVRGVADLIIVKSDGTVDIVDFKVANTPFKQWCATKLYKTEYQLGAYRQILAANGIDASKIGLYTQPIFLNRNNAEDTYVEPKQNMLLARVGKHPYAHLNWEYGEFSTNLRKLIGTNVSMSVPESVKIDEKAMEKFQEMVPYKPSERMYNRESLIARIHQEKRNDKIVFKFFDALEKKPIEKSSLEEFTKEGGYIDQYIRKMKNIKNEWVITLATQILDYQKQNQTGGFDFLHTKNSPGQLETIMSTIFGEFTKPYYKLLDIPAFIENNILAFENTSTGIIQFITITDQILTDPIAEGQFGNMLGNFYANDEVRQMNHITVLPATCENAEMLKTVHLINSIAEENPQFFTDKSIGTIRVVNPTYGTNNSIPIKNLLSNYQLLCSKTHTPYHFQNEIQLANEWEAFGFMLKQIENTYTEDEDLRKIVKSFKANTYSDSGKITQLIRMRRMLETYKPKYRAKDFISKQTYNENDPVDAFYIMLCELIAYYQKIPIDPSGNFDKYGFRLSSVVDLLCIPFTSNQALLDKDGNPIRGVLNGLTVTSAENSPSPTLRALAEYYQVAYSHIREEFQKAHSTIQNITLPYVSKFQSQANRVFSGANTNMWTRLLVKDQSGEISKTLMLRNPYQDNSLSKEDALFLKSILWEINKHRYSNLLSDYINLTYEKDANQINGLLFDSGTEINKLITSQRYFELPLKRARYFERWKKVGRLGLSNLLKKELETLRDDWDPTKVHGSQKSMIAAQLRENATTMYNQYNLSLSDRTNLIDKEQPEDFETDLDLLALDVAFQDIRQDYFENVLQTTAAIATLLHVNQAMTGINRHPELEALESRSGTAIKNKSEVPEEAEDISKVVSAARQLNSVLVLAFRPLQMVKELTFGMFTNVSRVFGSKGSSDKLSLKSVFDANKTIWGQSIGKWASAFTGDADIASYTLCEWINKLYGIANEDINRTVDTSMLSRHGMISNNSKWMYLANSAPDYFNRLTLFVAKMMEDGCFEAHSLTKNGELVYDFKKDKRFSELVKHGLNSDYKGEEYRRQKALYIAMAEQFGREGRNFIEYKKDGTIEYKEFDRAYTTKQRNSIKEVADLAYGYYDHETKSLVDLGFFGLIYKQFQTFLTAKTNLWFRGRPSTKGDNTAQGRFVPIEINGEKYYRRIIFNKDGSIQDVVNVAESNLTEEEKGNLDYAYTWQGDYVEGLLYSILGTLHDIFHADFKSLKENKYRRANLALAMHDILIGMILFSIFKWLFSGGTNKMQDVKPLQRVLLRGMQDVSPSALTGMSWEPGFYTTLVNIKDDAISIFSDDDPDLAKMLTKRVGAIKDWTYNEKD